MNAPTASGHAVPPPPGSAPSQPIALDAVIPPWRERFAAAFAASCVIGIAYLYWSA